MELIFNTIQTIIYFNELNLTFLLNLINLTTFDFSFILIQVFLVYILIHIFYECNVLRLVLNILLLLLVLAGLLMIFQFELFACFLIVSEILLFSFIYAYLYSLNLVNKTFTNAPYNTNLYYLIILLLLVFVGLLYLNINTILHYMTDLLTISTKTIHIYSTIMFSDLIFLFNFFFIYNSFLYVLLVIILFIMTFIIIYTTFLVYLINLNVNLFKLSFLTDKYDNAGFNSTLYIKKKKKIQKLRIFKLN